MENTSQIKDDYFSIDEDVPPALFQTAKILTVYIQPIVCILGLAGNFLALLVFLSKDLRKVSSNIYLIGLSLSGFVFLLALFIVWLEVVNVRLVHKHIWCQCIVFTTYVCSFLTVWFVVCITVENYIVTFHLKKAAYFCTVFKAKVVVISITVTGIFIYIFAVWETKVIKFMGINLCTESKAAGPVTTIFTYVDTLVTLVLPTVVLVFLISAILIKHLWRRHQQRQNYNEDNTRQRLSKKEKSLLKITRVLLAIGLTYVVLSGPCYINKIRFIIITSMGQVGVSQSERFLNQIFQVIFYFTFCVNFVFYTMWSVNFKRGLIRLFTFKCRSSGYESAIANPQTNTMFLNSTNVHSHHSHNLNYIEQNGQFTHLIKMNPRRNHPCKSDFGSSS